MASKVKPNTLSVLIYHGQKRTKSPHKSVNTHVGLPDFYCVWVFVIFLPPPPPPPSPTSLAAHDVVITTYDTIGSEGAAALSDVSTPLSHLPSTVSPLSSSVG